jgi:methylenetetrahydrofolate reductase (NADPH)
MNVSFEVFPPKSSDDLHSLRETVAELAVWEPAFVSVTYGAGGSDRQRSFDAIGAVGRHAEVAAHLTCVGQSRAELDDVVDRYRSLGVGHVVALRGDPPAGVDAAYAAHPDGFRSTAQLVTAVRDRGIADVSVSAYPEVHPQSPSLRHDLGLLAEKVDAGATRAITQMCFDTDALVRYADAVLDAGIDVAVVPGIFPIHSFTAVARFAQRCGASIPEPIAVRFWGIADDEALTHKVGAELAAEQIAALADRGLGHVHLYTLNRSSLAHAVCEQL